MASPTVHDFWVFGYGSLMWRPGFRFTERLPAAVTGYHRALCIASTLHRGTPARPGLVLGLDRGGTCAGMLYRVAPEDVPMVLAYLRERELIYGVYRETWVRAEMRKEEVAPAAESVPRAVTALAYTVERCHPSYLGRLPLARQAEIVRGARGQSGANLDYLLNTVRHLRELGIRERPLERLAGVAAGHAANASRDCEHRPCVRGLCRTWARRPTRLPRLPSGDQRRFGHRLVPIAS